MTAWLAIGLVCAWMVIAIQHASIRAHLKLIATQRARIAQLESAHASQQSSAAKWRTHAARVEAQLRHSREAYKRLAWNVAAMMDEGSDQQRKLREHLAAVEMRDLLATQRCAR